MLTPKKIKVDAIICGRQVSKTEEVYQQLVASVRKTGPLNPIVVRPYGRSKDKYVVIDGARRLEAARDLGMSEIDCMVQSY